MAYNLPTVDVGLCLGNAPTPTFQFARTFGKKQTTKAEKSIPKIECIESNVFLVESFLSSPKYEKKQRTFSEGPCEACPPHPLG